MSALSPYFLTPKVARNWRARRGPNLFLSPAGFLIWGMCLAMGMMLIYTLTLTWDFGVLVYGGIGYLIAVGVKRLRRPQTEV